MKKQHTIFLILLSIFALGACDKESSSSSNLEGTWDIASLTQKSYTNGTLDTTEVQTNLGTITFNASGDGQYSFTAEQTAQSGTFDWFEKNDKVFINMINLSDSILTKNLAIGFDVMTNTKTEQVWSATVSQYDSGENNVSYLVKTYIELGLKKK